MNAMKPASTRVGRSRGTSGFTTSNYASGIERNYACRPGGLFQNWRRVKSILLLAAVPACLPRQARSEVQTILPDGQWQVADSVRQKELPESARVQTAGIPKQDRNYFWYRKTFKAPANADGKCILKATAKPAAKGWEAPTISRRWATAEPDAK
jgi:hypothetical protein